MTPCEMSENFHDCQVMIAACQAKKPLFLKETASAEIYKHLEKVSDRFDDVANEINSIVIEQV